MAEWARIDVNFLRHPQVSRLSTAGQVGYLAMILYAQEHETDGHIPRSCLKWCDVSPKLAAAMESAGLVTKTADGWHITGFLNYQRSREEMSEARKAASDKASRAARARWDKPARPSLEAVN
jgi:hypothetical protein